MIKDYNYKESLPSWKLGWVYWIATRMNSFHFIIFHTSRLDEEAVVFLVFAFWRLQILPLVARSGQTDCGAVYQRFVQVDSDEPLAVSVPLASCLAPGHGHGERVGLFWPNLVVVQCCRDPASLTAGILCSGGPNGYKMEENIIHIALQKYCYSSFKPTL